MIYSVSLSIVVHIAFPHLVVPIHVALIVIQTVLVLLTNLKIVFHVVQEIVRIVAPVHIVQVEIACGVTAHVLRRHHRAVQIVLLALGVRRAHKQTVHGILQLIPALDLPTMMMMMLVVFLVGCGF